MHNQPARSAFTLPELLLVIAIIALLIAILLPVLGKSRASSRQMKCATNVRGIGQASILWANSHRDLYPLPSLIDKANKTVVGQSQFGKDVSKNIFSLLIFNGFIPVTMCVSPAESNTSVEVFQNYQYTDPDSAASADKSEALWDPAFRATPAATSLAGGRGDTGQGVSTTVTAGGLSYAHSMPLFERKARWKNTFVSNEAVFSNRGPQYDMNGAGATATWRLKIGNSGTRSNTLLIHGNNNVWEGNIAFNDGHLDFATRPDPKNIIFTFSSLPAGSKSQSDNIFVNENDQTRAVDASLGANNTNALMCILSAGSVVTGSVTPWSD